MGCKGQCLEFATNKRYYLAGNRRCSVCEVWLPAENIRCPCCNTLLRTKIKRKNKGYKYSR